MLQQAAWVGSRQQGGRLGRVALCTQQPQGLLGVQCGPRTGALQDMAQVAQQAVADVGGSAGHAAQRHAQGQARCGLLQALAGACQIGRGELQRGRRACAGLALVQQLGQRQAGVAQGAAHIHIVTDLGAAAQQGLAARHFAKHGDADVQGATGGVAAYELAAVRIGQRQQPLGEGLQPGRIGFGQGQRQGEGQRAGAAGGQVAEVDGQGLVAQGARVYIGKEMAPGHQHVGGDRQLHARCGLQQGAVISHAQHRARRGAREKALDQVELAHAGSSLLRGRAHRPDKT